MTLKWKVFRFPRMRPDTPLVLTVTGGPLADLQFRYHYCQHLGEPYSDKNHIDDVCLFKSRVSCKSYPRDTNIDLVHSKFIHVHEAVCKS